MLTDYTARKNEVLAEYERFEEVYKSFEKVLTDAKLPGPLAQYKVSLDDARDKSEKIRADRYVLIVAGEAKSGKSTFINAFLGVELLPMDVKQCTSSIIEIKYGPKFRLAATLADGRQQICENENEIRTFLRKNAALDDEYRDIPVPTIHYDLLVRYGRQSKGNQVYIPEHVIKNFLAAPEIKAANVHNIGNYNSKIWEYIIKKKNDWRNIVTKIELFFPFGDEALKGIEIIDSPGVLARGGVAEITEEYIRQADAIMFLKPVSGQSTESKPFTDFMNSASIGRNHSAIFLVLTRTTNVTPSELKRIEEDVYKKFSQLDRDHILFVDSKAELYANRFSSVQDIESRIRELNAAGELDDFVKSAWFDADGNKELFLDALRQKSNFSVIEDVLSRFGRRAHYLALAALLELMAKIYTRMIGDLKNHAARFREKAANPTELANKIGKIKLELESIHNKMNREVKNMVRKYNGDEGDIKKKIDDEVENFKKEIDRISAYDDQSFNKLERLSFQKIKEFKDLQRSIQQTVVAECNAALIAISNESEIPHTSLEPDFSAETFERIKQSTESEAIETRTFEEGITFKKTRTTSEYSRHRHFHLVKSNILSRIENIGRDLYLNLADFVEKIADHYLKELKRNADFKEKELDAVYEAKLETEQILGAIDRFNAMTVICETSRRDAEKVRGGMAKYVQ